MTFQATFKSEGYTPDGLVAGNASMLYAIKVTVLSGQNLKRGAVVGRVTASSKYVLSATAAGNGSETPAGILSDDIDATSGDKEAMVYIRGDFNASALTLGAGHTVASIAPAFRDAGIFIVIDQGGV